jgi:hypothetical protein
VTRQLVTTVLDARGHEAADQDLDWIGDMLASAGAVDSVISVDARTGQVRATFAVDEDPSRVIEDLRSQLESRAGWSLAGTASYAVSEQPERGGSASPWPAAVLASAAFALWVCVFAGLVPYDFDDGPMDYLLGVLLFAIPLGIAAFVAARQFHGVGRHSRLRAP